MSTDNNQVYDVIVIGLGPAGIAAYTKLYENGLKVLPLEAGNRIGGRVNSVAFGDAIIDLGAEWCHGEENNVVHEMVKDYNYVESSGMAGLNDVTFVDSTGNLLSKELSEKMSLLCCDITYEGRERVTTNSESLGDNFIAVYKYLLNTENYVGVPRSIMDQTLEWFHKYENSLEASDTWFDTSGSTYSEYWECEGDHLLHWKGNGYKTVLDLMLKKVPDSCLALMNNHLNKEVTKIEYKNYCKNDVVEVKCKDGCEYLAKHVIITVSLGVLKERYNMFSPPLPSEKINSIKNLAIGTVNKIFLHFNKRWWLENMKWVGFLWREEDKKKLSTDDHWLCDIFGFNSNDGQPNVLCLWITGVNSRYMETLPIEEVLKGCCRILNIFLGKEFEIPTPVNIIRSTWYSNPLFRGSYTFRSMDSDKYDASSATLAAPIWSQSGTPIICFAGESTSTHYYSTVHGAIESGFRESKMIIEHIKAKNEVPMHLNYNGKMIPKKVVIVGGGVAGLSTAKTFIDRGLTDIVLIESSERFGGRIHSVQVNNNEYIELGAQWIHGDSNKFTQFAKEHNLITNLNSNEGEGRFLRNDGYEYSPDIVKVINSVVAKILEECESFYTSNEEFNFSIGEYLWSEFQKYIEVNVDSKEVELWNEIFNWHVRFQCVDNACISIDNLSAKLWGIYDFDGGNSQSHISFKCGYSSVIEKLIEGIPRQVLQSSTTVKEIKWNNNSKVNIYCLNGAAYEADHVIVTVPLGVLKSNHKKMFYPELPRNHTSAIESIGFGPIGKVFLEFATPWWGDCKGFQLTWTQSELDKLKTTFKKSADWVKYISGFDVLTVGPRHTLLGWVSSAGNEILQDIPDSMVSEQCHDLLKRFTGNGNIPKPVNVYRSNWNKNPHIKGGFSHLSRECDKTKTGPKTLSEPVFSNTGKPELLFAGEACHPTFFSTVHGAFETGIQQAEIVCQFIESNGHNLSKL